MHYANVNSWWALAAGACRLQAPPPAARAALAVKGLLHFQDDDYGGRRLSSE